MAERSPIPSADDVAAWNVDERHAVSRLLDAAGSPQFGHRRPMRQRRVVIAITTIGAIVLVPWIIILGYTLPDSASVGAWRVAWVGFDTLLASSLAISAWAMWRRRQFAIVALTTASVALTLDIWFDVSLSWGTKQQWGSILLAIAVEGPVLVVLVATIAVMLRRIGATVARLRGLPEPRSVLHNEMPMSPPGRG